MDEIGINYVSWKNVCCCSGKGLATLGAGTIEAYFGDFRFFVDVSCDIDCKKEFREGLCNLENKELQEACFPELNFGNYKPLRKDYFDYLKAFK